MKSCSDYENFFSSQNMTNLSPLSSYDDDSHVFLVTTGKKIIVQDGIRPLDFQNAS